jgi:hypothetical protein
MLRAYSLHSLLKGLFHLDTMTNKNSIYLVNANKLFFIGSPVVDPLTLLVVDGIYCRGPHCWQIRIKSG